MSDPSTNILERVRENLFDPHAVHHDLQRFNLTAVAQAVQVAVEDNKLADELLAMSEALHLCLESPLIALMKKNHIMSAFFTSDTNSADRRTYEQAVVPGLEEGLEKAVKRFGYTCDYFQKV